MIVTVVLSGLWVVIRKRTTSLSLGELIYEALLIGWVGFYASVTMTPSWQMDWSASEYSCNMNLAKPVQHLMNLADRSLNVWLTVPAGIFIPLSKRWRPGWLLAALCAPLVAEYWQLRVPGLMRQCNLYDIQDNYQGILTGFVVGFILLVLKYVVKAIRHLATGRGRVEGGALPEEPRNAPPTNGLISPPTNGRRYQE